MADVRGKMGRIFSCVIAFAFGVSGVRAQVFGFAAEGVSSGKASENVVVADGFWDNWFVQAGLDMSLMNPYGANFSKVIPKGMTFGLNAAVGKWFTPEFGLRGRVQWDNGLIPNNSVEWVPPVDDPRQNYKKGGLAQPAARHNWPRFITNTVASVGMAYIGKTALKAIINEERPDHSDNKSFPSGHASMAFAAARSLDKEFRKENIWIPIAGYTAATAIGVERVVSDRHHWYDVVAGAALGFGASELIWWLSDELLGKGSDVVVGSSGQTVDLKYSF